MSDSRFEFVTHDASASEHIAAPSYSYWRSVSRQFFGKKLTVFLLIVIVLLSLIALIQPALSGYDPMISPNINNPEMRFLGISFQYPYGTDGVGSFSLGRRLGWNKNIFTSWIYCHRGEYLYWCLSWSDLGVLKSNR